MIYESENIIVSWQIFFSKAILCLIQLSSYQNYSFAIATLTSLLAKDHNKKPSQAQTMVDMGQLFLLEGLSVLPRQD